MRLINLNLIGQHDKESELLYCVSCENITEVNCHNELTNFCPVCGAHDSTITLRGAITNLLEAGYGPTELICAFRSYDSDQICCISRYQYVVDKDTDIPAQSSLANIRSNGNDHNVCMTIVDLVKENLVASFESQEKYLKNTNDKIVLKNENFDFSKLKVIINISREFNLSFTFIVLDDKTKVSEYENVINENGAFFRDTHYIYEFGEKKHIDLLLTDSEKVYPIDDGIEDHQGIFKYYFELFNELGIEVYINSPANYKSAVTRAKKILEFNEYLEKNEPDLLLRISLKDSETDVKKGK